MFSQQRGSVWGSLPPVTKNLIIINFIVWAFTAISPRISNFLWHYCALHYIEASDFNVVQLFTGLFIHGGFMHIFFNMFGLFMFGNIIERAVGSGRYLFFYLSCGVGASLIQEFAWWATLDQVIGYLYGLSGREFSELFAAGQIADYQRALNLLVCVGASGAIYGVLLAFGMLFPNVRLSIMFLPIFVKAKWMVIGYGVIELLIGMSGAGDGVAHFAHLGGMLFGLFIILYWKKKGIINGPIY